MAGRHSDFTSALIAYREGETQAFDRLVDLAYEELKRIVECRYFAGLTEPETAEALQTSLRSVQRGWWKARAWLGEELGRARG